MTPTKEEIVAFLAKKAEDADYEADDHRERVAGAARKSHLTRAANHRIREQSVRREAAMFRAAIEVIEGAAVVAKSATTPRSGELWGSWTPEEKQAAFDYFNA